MSPAHMPKTLPIHHSRSLAAMVCCTLLALASCAGTTQIEREPVTAALTRYQAIALTVDETVDEDVTEEMKELQERVVAAVESLHSFTKVTAADAATAPQPCLRVEATIKKVRKVSDSARFWSGAFAGKASLTAEVRFLDEAGTSLGCYEITGTSGSTGFSGGTGDAVANVAKDVASLIARLRKTAG